MKIAIFASEIPSTVFIENLIKGLAQRGHTIHLYGKYVKDPNYGEYKNIHIYKEPKTKVGMVLYAIRYFFILLFSNPKKIATVLKISKTDSYLYWFYRFNFYATVLSFNADILHIQWVNAVLFIDSLVESKLIKTVVSLRGTHINVTPLYQEACKKGYIKVFPSVSGFHGVSHTIIKEAQKYDSTANERAHVAYPAVTEATLNKFKTRNNPQGEKFNVISIGRHHWKKGYNFAFDAIKILKDKNIPVNYTIVAEGKLDEQLIHQVKDLDIENEIKITGSLPHAKVLETVQNADAFLLPSLEEGVANVVLEAMAVGTPVVSTDCGGMLEVIKDDENGFIVKSGYANLLADALEKVYHLNEEQRKQMTIKAHETIVEKHTLETQLNEIEKLYKQVLNS